ncbi:MAG: tripartite tricarboxylate transporter permease, partial [Rhodospirillum sp.]|nr:tripartite tricarboxylate transporter permease [Rhodospirillum sp.]
IGAIVLSIALVFAEPLLRRIGFSEQLMLIVFALSMVGMMTGTSHFKGLASCGLGLMLGAFGAAPITGVERLGFGTEYLIEPIPMIIVGLGLFAIPEIVSLARQQTAISESGRLKAGWLAGLRDWKNNWWLSLRCAIIGCLGGALPGIGGSVIDWIAYGHAIQTTKNPERYGTGDVRGVIAPESANNAKEGGALIPTLIFGIPGSGNMAILLGGFILIGIQPGLSMIRDNGDVVYSVVWSLALANILGAGFCLLFARYIAWLTTIPYLLIAPFMIGLIYFASFQATRGWGDLVAMFVLGILGVYLKRFGWSRPALLIGFVLAPQIESNVYRASTIYGWEMFTRPIVLVLIGLTILSVVSVMRRRVPESVHKTAACTYANTVPQKAFFILLAGFAAYVFTDGFGYNFLTGTFQVVAGGASLVFMVPLGIQLFLGSRTSCHFDEEGALEAHGVRVSGEHYVAVLAFFLACVGLFGFLVGAGFFIGAFLVWKARVRVHWAVMSGAAFSLFLFFIAYQLNLQYPTGLLNRLLPFWP